MAVPVWLCGTVEKDENAIASVFSTTLPIVESANVAVSPGDQATTKLQIAAARVVSRLISCIRDGNLLRPLFADASFKDLPKEVSVREERLRSLSKASASATMPYL